MSKPKAIEDVELQRTTGGNISGAASKTARERVHTRRLTRTRIERGEHDQIAMRQIDQRLTPKIR